jgi:hypothetical protein
LIGLPLPRRPWAAGSVLVAAAVTKVSLLCNK